MAEELGPLEESVLLDLRLEGVSVDEGVRIVGLAGTTGACRPRATEPQCWISFDETRRERPLPRSAGAGDDEDQDFEVWESSASR
jgi:hypothetical protein